MSFKCLVTGSAGFIGSALTIRLLERGDIVIGIDNHNDYYDPAIKQARLDRFSKHTNYTHFRIDLADRKAIEDVFDKHKPQRVVNLAAQAGVRYSIENPLAYIDSNIVGVRVLHDHHPCLGSHPVIEHVVPLPQRGGPRQSFPAPEIVRDHALSSIQRKASSSFPRERIVSQNLLRHLVQ